MSKGSVLVVEDDAAIRQGVVDALEFEGYETIACGDGRRGLDLARGGELDLLLLDVILPGIDGFQVLTELRRSRPTLPVILLTARGAETDRVRGLRMGADDYVVKPFSARELLARVEAVLRRSAERPADVTGFSAGGRTVNLERREVRLANGETALLSESETGILRYLAANRGRAVAREELLQHVWGWNPRGVRTRTVDMHVARLREKIGDAGGTVLVTVRSKGYMLAGDAEP